MSSCGSLAFKTWDGFGPRHGKDVVAAVWEEARSAGCAGWGPREDAFAGEGARCPQVLVLSLCSRNLEPAPGWREGGAVGAGRRLGSALKRRIHVCVQAPRFIAPRAPLGSRTRVPCKSKPWKMLTLVLCEEGERSSPADGGV